MNTRLRNAVALACLGCLLLELVGLRIWTHIDSLESLAGVMFVSFLLALPYAPVLRTALYSPSSRPGLVGLLFTVLLVGMVMAAGLWFVTAPVDSGGCGLGPSLMF